MKLDTVIILYGMKDDRRKIASIKVLRAIAKMRGAELGLRAAKNAIDNIDSQPITVDNIVGNEIPIVRAALDAYFVTVPPQRERPVSLSSMMTWPEDDAHSSWQAEYINVN